MMAACLPDIRHNGCTCGYKVSFVKVVLLRPFSNAYKIYREPKLCYHTSSKCIPNGTIGCSLNISCKQAARKGS